MMQTRKLVMRALIHREDERTYALEYYIIENLAVDGTLNYGIEIHMNHNNTLQSAVVYLSGSQDYVLTLVELYAKNFVMPISLHDLIEDF